MGQYGSPRLIWWLLLLLQLLLLLTYTLGETPLAVLHCLLHGVAAVPGQRVVQVPDHGDNQINTVHLN